MWQNIESFPEARKAAKKDAVRDEPLETCLSYRKLWGIVGNADFVRISTLPLFKPAHSGQVTLSESVSKPVKCG